MVDKNIGDKYPDLVRDEWLSLMFYFQHEWDEDEITKSTFEKMTDALLTLKNYLPTEDV